ncbi:MAG: DUF4394 domain-containing protein [Timaviella obliquedivisa GSE-PSE-MK23-08B]|nr:DUF4394 domain-containing protein [Timaviella obliquedivisa GSE-PSE-MK23-08B]
MANSNLGRLNDTKVVTASVRRDDRFDTYQFRLKDRSSLTGKLGNLRGGNADLELFSRDRQRIAKSTTSGADSITQTLDAGVYFFRVKQRSGNDVSYRLRLSNAPFVLPDTVGNSQSEAKQISLGATSSSFVDSVSRSDNNDYYRFDVTTPGNLSLNLNGLSGNADVQVLNGNGNVIGSSTNAGNADESLNLNLAAGTFFVRVFPNAPNQSTPYSLNATLTPLKLFGLTEQNNLIAFNADNLNAVTVGAVTGLATGETLVGIDFRATTATAANGQSLNGGLYGLGSTNRLYSINIATGQATSIGTAPFSPGIDGASFGFDFNPAPDRIRLVSNTDQNLRLVPDGTMAPAGTVADGNAGVAGIQSDTSLSYITGDVNAGVNPNIVAAAYANNRVGGRTTQFVIDADLDVLVRQGSPGGNASSPFGASPNGGLLTTIGALGFDFGNNTAFDISTDSNLTDTAIATSGSTLYGINLATGAARNLGTVTANGAAVNVVGLSTRVV